MKVVAAWLLDCFLAPFSCVSHVAAICLVAAAVLVVVVTGFVTKKKVPVVKAAAMVCVVWFALPFAIKVNNVVNTVIDFVEAGKRRDELRAVVRNVSRETRVADVTITATYHVPSVPGGVLLSCFVTFYDGSSDGAPVGTQKFSIPGSELYVASVVYNFDYSELAAGNKLNICIPYCFYSDVVPQSDGVSLELCGDGSVPFFFDKPDDEIYGLAPDAYRRRLAELVAILKSPEQSRELGVVRIPYGSSIHKVAAPGSSYSIFVQQSGGLTARPSESF